MSGVIFDIKIYQNSHCLSYSFKKIFPFFFPFRLPLVCPKCFMVISFSNVISEQFRIKVILLFKMLCK